MQELILYIKPQFRSNVSQDYVKVDLFNDENVTLTQVIQDVRDIDKVFTDYSQTFSLPASRVNNKLFQHWYNPDVNGFDSNIQSDAIIELNYQPFKSGKIQLQEVKMKDNKPSAYRVTFFGKTVSLNNTFGEDQLDDLVWLDNFNYLNTYSNIKDGLNLGLNYTVSSVTYNDAIIHPLISREQRYIFDSTGNGDNPGNISNALSTNHGKRGVFPEDLKPAIKASLITKAIEEQYNITFKTSEFFDSTEFSNLYLWLNRKIGKISPDNSLTLSGVGFSCSSSSPVASCAFFNGSTPQAEFDDGVYKIETTATVTEFVYYVSIAPASGYSSVIYTLEVVDTITNTVLATKTGTGSQIINFRVNGTLADITLPIGGKKNLVAVVKSESAFNFNPVIDLDATVSSVNQSATYVVATLSLTSPEVVITENIPELKVIDFLKGIFKQFNLTAFLNDSDEIVVKTLDDFYADSTTSHDISKYIKTDENTVSEALPFSDINLQYPEPTTKLALAYGNIHNNRYGRLQYVANSSKRNEYNIDTPFGHMLYERLLDLGTGAYTEVQYGLSVNESDNEVLPKPLMFYGIYQTSISDAINMVDNVRPEDGGLAHNTEPNDSLTDYWMPHNASELGTASTAPAFNLNFGSEINSYTLTDYNGSNNSLFQKFYQNYIVRVFNTKTRIFKYQAILPLKFLLTYSLADKVFVNGRAFTINKITTKLQTGESSLELLNEPT